MIKNNKYNSAQKKQSGISLIEIMIGLVIGLVISAAAIQIFISNKAAFRLDAALSRMQDSGRFVIANMAEEIRMAGYMGCSSRRGIEINDVGDPDVGFTTATAIQGFENGASWTNPTTHTRVAGTDVVTVARASEDNRQLNAKMLTTNANLVVNTLSVNINTPLLITDCTNADTFRVSAVTPGSGTTTIAHGNSKNDSVYLSTKYPVTSQISTLQTSTYFVGTNASGTSSLYRASTTTDELVNGVEDMQILYGEDTNGNDFANNYVDASAVTSWDAVRSVRISLLLQSTNNITSSPTSITFNGASVNSGAGADKRLRTIYNSTVTLRNRLP